MHLEHIFESGHLFSTIVGWVFFLITSLQFSHLLPCAYDAWIVNRRIDAEAYEGEGGRKKWEAIHRLKKYHDFIIENTSYRNPSNSLNKFATHVMWMCGIHGILMLLSIFFPTVLEVIWFVLKITM